MGNHLAYRNLRVPGKSNKPNQQRRAARVKASRYFATLNASNMSEGDRFALCALKQRIRPWEILTPPQGHAGIQNLNTDQKHRYSGRYIFFTVLLFCWYFTLIQLWQYCFQYNFNSTKKNLMTAILGITSGQWTAPQFSTVENNVKSETKPQCYKPARLRKFIVSLTHREMPLQTTWFMFVCVYTNCNLLPSFI